MSTAARLMPRAQLAPSATRRGSSGGGLAHGHVAALIARPPAPRGDGYTSAIATGIPATNSDDGFITWLIR
jgi:hypothetical protein